MREKPVMTGVSDSCVLSCDALLRCVSRRNVYLGPQGQQVRAIAEGAGSAGALLDDLHAAVLSNYASYPDDFGAVAILRS